MIVFAFEDEFDLPEGVEEEQVGAALVGVVTHPEERGEKPLHSSLEMARAGVLAKVFVGRHGCEEGIEVALVLISAVEVVQNRHVDPVLPRSRFQSVALANNVFVSLILGNDLHLLGQPVEIKVMHMTRNIGGRGQAKDKIVF